MILTNTFVGLFKTRFAQETILSYDVDHETGADPGSVFQGLTGSNSVGYSHPPPRYGDGIHRRNIPRKSQTSESESVGGLGQRILLRSEASNPNKPVPKEKEISGSDVLLAIQRATAQRKRSTADKSKKTKIGGAELSSTAESPPEITVLITVT
ncbi:hypothetical protein Bca52824_044477 [Brassica carinata]|uniref:Uncharacterized protein n=1 Tax=Brassica carinata TaxID=52824 RepID=A0A8X7R8T7_BRACI|nr:hypothetical protein Bca52824_044477 [Brassica carinata]